MGELSVLETVIKAMKSVGLDIGDLQYKPINRNLYLLSDGEPNWFDLEKIVLHSKLHKLQHVIPVVVCEDCDNEEVGNMMYEYIRAVLGYRRPDNDKIGYVIQRPLYATMPPPVGGIYFTDYTSVESEEDGVFKQAYRVSPEDIMVTHLYDDGTHTEEIITSRGTGGKGDLYMNPRNNNKYLPINEDAYWGKNLYYNPMLEDIIMAKFYGKWLWMDFEGLLSDPPKHIKTELALVQNFI